MSDARKCLKCGTRATGLNPGSIRDICLGSAERKRKRAARRCGLPSNTWWVLFWIIFWMVAGVLCYAAIWSMNWWTKSSARQCPARPVTRAQGAGGTSVPPDPRPTAPDTQPRRGGSSDPLLLCEVSRNQPMGQSAGALFRAIRLVETGNAPHPVAGDNGAAIGPYQIHRSYWVDARMPDGSYEDCHRAEYAERVMARYWQRYAPEWRPETLARLHNAGPTKWRGARARTYWEDVQHYMNEYAPRAIGVDLRHRAKRAAARAVSGGRGRTGSSTSPASGHDATALVASAEGGSMSLTP